MNTLTQKIRSTTICLVTVAAIALPGTSQAGWFSDSKPARKISHVAHATAGNLQHKVSDISTKINEMAAQMAESRPLADAMKNGRLMAHLTELVHYVNEYQQEFQNFNNSGADEMRQDIKNLVNAVTGITDVLGMDSKVVDQLQRASNIIDKMPATFLYPLAKSGLSDKIKATRDRFLQLKDNLALIATLPREKDVFLYPDSYKADLCPLVTDAQTKTQLAVLGARIKYNKFVIEQMSKLVPEDLTINIEVIGGGGATIAKFPPQYLFKAMETILGMVEMRIDAYKSIGEAMCKS